LLEASAHEVVNSLATDDEVVKVTDLDEIMEMGVMITPALAIDGEVKSAGKVLAADQVAKYIKESK
jgi:hypothetical protein